MDALRFNLGKYLERHGITPYRLVKESGLATNTIYSLSRQPAQRIDLDTVSTILNSLERITGKPVSITDMLERTGVVPVLEQGDPDHLLEIMGVFDDADSPGDIGARVDEYLGLAQHEEDLEQVRPAAKRARR